MSLLERDALAERIAVVLLERQKIGDERRIQKQAYQGRNAESALARHYRLRGKSVGQQVDGRTDHPKSPPQPSGDIHSRKIAAVLPNEDKPLFSTLSFRRNSSNGPTAR